MLPARYLHTSIAPDTDNSSFTLQEKPEECVLSESGNVDDTSADKPTGNNENNDLYCPWPTENPTQTETETTSQIEDGDLYCSWPRGGEVNNTSSSVNGSMSRNSERNCSVCTISSEDEFSNSSSCNSPSESNKKSNGGSHSLRKKVLTHRRCHSSEWPVVKWAMRLPTRLHLEGRPNNPVRNGVMSSISDSKLSEDWPPKELQKFEEKFSPFCKIFGYEELQVATSNFSTGLFFSSFSYPKPNYLSQEIF